MKRQSWILAGTALGLLMAAPAVAAMPTLKELVKQGGATTQPPVILAQDAQDSTACPEGATDCEPGTEGATDAPADAPADGEEAPAEEAPAETPQDTPAVTEPTEAPAELLPEETAPAETDTAPAAETPAAQESAPTATDPATEAPAADEAAPTDAAPAAEQTGREQRRQQRREERQRQREAAEEAPAAGAAPATETPAPGATTGEAPAAADETAPVDPAAPAAETPAAGSTVEEPAATTTAPLPETTPEQAPATAAPATEAPAATDDTAPTTAPAADEGTAPADTAPAAAAPTDPKDAERQQRRQERQAERQRRQQERVESGELPPGEAASVPGAEQAPADGQEPAAQETAAPTEPPPPPPADDRAAQEAAQPAEIESLTEERGERRRERAESREQRREDRREARRESRPEGAEVLREFEDLVILEFNNQVIVESDDTDRLALNAREVYIEDLPRGRTREVVIRPNGVQVITIRNRFGDVIRRSKVLPGGQEVILVYVEEENLDEARVWRDPGLDLPPLRLAIPVDEYIFESEEADAPQDYYEFLDQPPVERVERLYSLDEVKRSSRIRQKARRVDLDTIRFAFGSAEIPESEVNKLEAIAQAMERLLQENPAETFLIEGHTDAVGSEIANLALSDRRAEAVARALTEVFAIPPENLATQGYGEQFLKVSTPDPEVENRRVSLRRITPLVAPVESASAQ